MTVRVWTNAFGAALGIALAFGTVGCGQTVSFSVLRAAHVNVKGMAGAKDATVSVGEWGGADGQAVEDVKQRIAELITNAEGGVIRFTTAQGVVRVDGLVAEHLYTERRESSRSTCSHYNSSTKRSESYPCTLHKRIGVARIRMSVSVVDQAGRVVASDSYANRAERSTSSTDGDPEGIDGHQLLADLRADGAHALAALVIPHRVMVTKRWFSCGDASDACAAGLLHLRKSNFGPARDQFTKAIDQLRAKPSPDTSAMAAAWWGIVLAHEFDGNYAGARTALEETIKLNPKEEVYADEVRHIADEERNAQKLANQGVGGD